MVQELSSSLEDYLEAISHIVDEKQAARVGQGLAARQIVVGLYGPVGSLSVLQLKRIDVETQQTLGVGSLQCPAGQEERLLRAMADLAAAVSKDG